MSKIAHGTRAFIQMGILNKGYVEQKTAEERASVCVECPHNNTDSTSMLIVLMEKITKGSTSKDNNLGVCELCGCVLRTLVHADASLVDLEHMDKHPSACWKHGLVKDDV